METCVPFYPRLLQSLSYSPLSFYPSSFPPPYTSILHATKSSSQTLLISLIVTRFTLLSLLNAAGQKVTTIVWNKQKTHPF